MSLLSTALPRPLSAWQRTALLHRMLLIRHLMEREMVTPDTNHRGPMPVLLCHSASVPATASSWDRAPLSVADALNVEAVLRLTRLILQAARTGAGPRRLGLCTAGFLDRDDPVDVLVKRMYADHQLDDNALQAIDADAASRAETWLSTLR